MAEMVRIRCPGCQKVFDAESGTVAPCPSCQKRLRAPAKKPAPPSPPAVETHPATPQPPSASVEDTLKAPVKAIPRQPVSAAEAETMRPPSGAAAGAPTSPRLQPGAFPAASAPANPAEMATMRAPPPHGRRRPSSAAPTRGDAAVTLPQQATDGTQPSSATGLASGELKMVGPYQITHLIGRGGMGVVYRAVDTRLGRTVALKVLRAGGDAAPEELARFRLEAQNAARLQHPHIVPIHDTGHVGDLDYFTMDYIEGGTLGHWLGEKQRSYVERAQMLEKIVRAVHHAHEQNIIHRDLKPSNVMVDHQGEPHVMDFGLARNVESAQGLTVSGAALGTPQYMPPEQAKGAQKEIGPHSDVWALGAILYEMLCGTPPFHGDAVFQILRAVVQDEPVPPRNVVRNLPRDLDTICLKCLEKDPARRYPSAAALADDLRAYVASDPISARPLSGTERAWRACRKRPVLSVAAVLVLAFSGVAGWLLHAGTATRRAAALRQTVEAGLTERMPTAEELERLDRLCQDLEALDKDAAAGARRDVNKSLAAALERLVQQPRLEEEDLRTVEAGLEGLTARDQALAGEVREKYRQRVREWDKLFDLPPFKDVDQVFKKGAVAADESGLRCPKPEKSPAGPLCATKVSAAGNVQLEASFAQWRDAAAVGLGLKAATGRGYAFVLRAHAPLAAKGDAPQIGTVPVTLGSAVAGLIPATLEVWRAGSKAGEYHVEATKLTTEQLSMLATREGSTFTVQIGGLPSQVFDDPFALPARESGCFEAILPGQARIRLLRATRQTLPATPSPLEQADDLFERGRYEEAFSAYKQQGLQTMTGAVGEEVRYKQGLCLAKLGRVDEANRIFGEVSEKEGKRWPVLALCQIMLICIEKGDLERAWALVDLLDRRFDAQQIMVSIPETLKDRLREMYTSEFSGMFLLGSDPGRVAKLERALKATRLIDATQSRYNQVVLNLVRAKHWQGDFPAAERYARDGLAKIAENDWAHLILVEELGWLLRLRDRAADALILVNELLLDKDGRLRPERLGYLVERARNYCALEQWDRAEADLDLLIKNLPLKDHIYRAWGGGYLLKGFLAERRGDKQAMEEAWKAGTVERWQEAAGEKEFPKGTTDRLVLMNLACLSGTLKQRHLDLILDTYGEKGATRGGKADSPVQMLLKVYYDSMSSDVMTTVFKVTPETLIPLWHEPCGINVAKDLALRRVPLNEVAAGPICLLVYDIVRRSSGRPLTDTEDKVLWDAAHAWFEGFRQGKISMTQLLQVGTTYSGMTDNLGWGGLAGKLSPEVRGPLAYFFGLYYQTGGKLDETLMFLQTAQKDAPAGSPLRKLAEDELKRLGAKEK